jgi:hypothetical protein
MGWQARRDPESVQTIDFTMKNRAAGIALNFSGIG